MTINGIFAVFKQVGPSSSTIVQSVRRVVGGRAWKHVKIGHGGTLDPLASGVLVLGVGKATKLLENFIKCEKRYRATGKFGIETQSGDLGSPVVREGVPFTHISLSQFNNTLRKYTGVIDQIPPMYSALHYKGERLYNLARKGVSVPIKPRKVCVHSILCTRFEPPEFDLEIVCEGGTYVRKLIVDIASDLGSCATTIALQRIAQGPFTLTDCLYEEQWSLDNIKSAIERYAAAFKQNKNENTH